MVEFNGNSKITLDLLGKKVVVGRDDVPARVNEIYSQTAKTHIDVYGIMCETAEVKDWVRFSLYGNFEEALIINSFDDFEDVNVEDLSNRNDGNIAIVVDSSNFYLSPNRQRAFIYDIVQKVKDWELKGIKIFVFTTSFYTLTDILNHNLIIFDENGERTTTDQECFCANPDCFISNTFAFADGNVKCFATEFINFISNGSWVDIEPGYLNFIGNEPMRNFLRNRLFYLMVEADEELRKQGK